MLRLGLQTPSLKSEAVKARNLRWGCVGFRRFYRRKRNRAVSSVPGGRVQTRTKALGVIRGGKESGVVGLEFDGTEQIS